MVSDIYFNQCSYTLGLCFKSVYDFIVANLHSGRLIFLRGWSVHVIHTLAQVLAKETDIFGCSA